MASATGSGRWTQSASGPSGFLPSTRTGWPGLPTTVEFAGTSWITTELAPILHRVADLDRAEQLRARADHHLVADGRVALAAGEARAAQRHALVHRHVVAHLGGLADHDSRAVVDEQAAPDVGGRVDLHPGHHLHHVGEHARRQRHAGLVQGVRDPVRQAAPGRRRR